MSIKKLAERSAVTNDPNPEALEYDLDPYPYPDINQTYGRICLDIETTSTKWYLPDTKIFLVGIATQTGHRWIFTEKSLQQAEFQAWLRSFVAHHGRQIGGHNYKFDVLYLNKQFGTPLTVGWDTLAMVNVFNEHWYKDLKSLATYFYNADDYAERLVHSWLKTNIKRVKQRSFDKVPTPQIYDYLLCDIEYNLHLSWALEAHLRMENQWEYPYLEHEVRQVNMLTEVENT
ncbi:MAG: hypothetical protein GWO08_03460, partial [Gammaproteobacteria bacterium]|nr:hypothetical protein [Gammaproteobacteria bacterium]